MVDTGENMNQQIYARGLCQDFNQTRATETEKREEILKKLLAFCGDNVWIEPPLTLAMGKTGFELGTARILIPILHC